MSRAQICSAADVDGAVITVFRVESEKLQARLAGSHAGIQKNRWYVKFSLELAFDGADALEGMERLQVGDEQQRVLLAFERLQRGFEPIQ